MNAQHIAREQDQLWVFSMGKRFLVRAIFTTTEQANEYMEKHSDTALIACFGPFNVIANQYAGVKE
jgi:hypothetical protein